MNIKKKVLLLTDIFPSNNYSGGIMNQQLCYFLLEEKVDVHCALIKQQYTQEQPDDIIQQNLKTITFQKPQENTNERQIYKKEIDHISEEVIKYIKENQIDIVWSPIQCESVLRVLAILRSKLPKLRIVAQIWDPFEWGLHERKYSENDKVQLLDLFDEVMNKVDFILTASRPMTAIYKKKYHTPCHHMYISYNYFKAIKAPRPDNVFTIVLSGQTYAKKSIQSFIQALDSLNWQHNNTKIILKYFGPNQDDILKNNQNVIMGGYVSQEELIKNEADADLLYCPYFFDNCLAYQKVSQQSYPSKIVTYLPAQTPILIHANSDCPIYKDFKQYNCGYLLNSFSIKDITKIIKKIIGASKNEKQKIIENENKLWKNYFLPKINKKSFLSALGLKYNEKNISILEINNTDLIGKRWNGYDLTNYINNYTPHFANQICTSKTSGSKNVSELYDEIEQALEYELLNFENKELSVHSCLSSSSPILMEKNLFKNADVIHFHLIHNFKLSLISLIELCNKKPAIITIHDHWWFTGRCVLLEGCTKYLTGCQKCPNLKSLFPLKCDNCHDLWELKKFVYDHIDVDYVVTTKYMYDLFQNSPLTKGKRVHLIPFGIDVDEFSGISQKEARKKYNIKDDEIVIFHRAQRALKGTNYVVKALKKLDTNKKITILTCGEAGLLDEIKNRYRIIDLGSIDSNGLKYAYNACDFYLMPSIGESFGFMAIEAMSCEKPVICFDNTALPSVIFAPECGIAVEDRNANKLAEAIKWMAEDDQERIRRGKLGRKLVKENYSLEDYHKKIIKLYEDVAKRKHNFNLSVLEKPIEENDSVISLKRKLNKLTSKLFFKFSKQYKRMLFRIDKNVKTPSKKINYGDVNTQLLLNQYNNNVVPNWRDFNKNPFDRSQANRFISLYIFYKLISKKTCSFLKLLTHDRKKLKSVILDYIRK